MRLRTLAPILVAIMVVGATSAYAFPHFTATVAHGGAYDVTWDENDVPWYSYFWEVRYNGIDSGESNERMTGFALYDLPELPWETAAPTEVTVKGIWVRDVVWGQAQVLSTEKHGNAVYWPARTPGPNSNNPVYPGETIGLFRTTFSGPVLTDDHFRPHLPSAIHVQFGEDSEWINNTPEPVSAVLLALGIPLALASRRRRTGEASTEA